MGTNRQDLLDAFLQLMRDEYPATVSFAPDSAELAAVLEALRKAAAREDPPRRSVRSGG